MRKLLQSNNVVYIGRSSPSMYGRRPIVGTDRGVTCIVLVRHGESRSKLAWLVSDTGDRSKAVWIPKSMVTVDQPSERGILVATISKTFADQKGLCAHRIIDPSLFNHATAEVLRDANARAARKRNFYRGHRQPDGRHINQNAFA